MLRSFVYSYFLPGAVLAGLVLIACTTPSDPARPNRPLTSQGSAIGPKLKTLTVPATENFELTGDGSNPNWEKAPFEPLEIREGGTLDFSTRVKLLYSDTGIYILMEAADSLLTATLTNDYEHLWTEDVFEAFFWTDEAHTVYFEYEISPLGYELPLLIPNLDGHYLGWIPWEYEGGRKIRKALSTIGGPQESGARIEGWRAEIFVPYALLNPLQNVPPTPGSHWRANFYRNDYDAGDPTRWEWSPTGASYHEIAQYGVLNFQ